MSYILLTISMLSMVLHNGVSNNVSKKFLKGKSDTMSYNAWMYLSCIILFGLGTIGSGISLFSVVLGAVFGAITMIAGYFRARALSKGPMHITVLLITASLIIPALSGVFMFGEEFSIQKLIAIFVLIFFIYVSLQKSDNMEIKKGWFLYSMLSFVFQGGIGVVQKIHQSSVHKDELFIFLTTSFVFSFILSAINAGKEIKMEKPLYLFAGISGLCTFIMNLFNLKLSGIIPSQIFFPLVNGGSIILTSAVAVVFFKEKITTRQAIGLVGGLVALVLICIL